ncbi:hypothetical protein AGG97_14010 [Klebsiella michiganensis]|nr:hypothetical protein AGH21_25855 [Klebsiella oxytoca]OLP14515.1 hypothetical protein AGG97_14010 [Klebsiella michiganensis]
MRFVIIFIFGRRKRLIIRVTKNSLYPVVMRIFTAPLFKQSYFIFLRVAFGNRTFKTSKRICICVRLVANVVRWRWLLLVSQPCQDLQWCRMQKQKGSLMIQR